MGNKEYFYIGSMKKLSKKALDMVSRGVFQLCVSKDRTRALIKTSVRNFYLNELGFVGIKKTEVIQLKERNIFD